MSRGIHARMQSASGPVRSRRHVRRRRLLPALAIAALVAGAVVMVKLAARDRSDHPRTSVPGCVDGPVTPGIDVSYHQERIAWTKVRKAGIRFAFIRVSDGLTVVDPELGRNWEGAKRAGILRGAYQFFRPEESATAQADQLIDAIRRDPGELRPVIDVEVTGGRSPEKLAAAIRVWVERVRSRLGVDPIVYTSPAFWRDHVRSDAFADLPLWVAHYTTSCPRVPAPWTRWTFWQHSKTGRVPGIKRDVDLNVFAGDIDALRR